MFKKFSIIILFLFLISITAVSAIDDGENLENLKTNHYNITNANYNDYFQNTNGNLKNHVNDGDTIEITEDFQDKNFNFNKSVNIIGRDNVKLKNCMLTFSNNASQSNISKLNIYNTNYQTYGIFLNGASNCVIKDCFINNTGESSFPICVANNANYNNITNNNLHAYGITYGHGTRSTPPLLLSGAHYNYVANNNISCDDANAIYLSNFPGGPLNGGNCYFNIIYNNTIKYNVLPTSWAYGIQVMGSNNKIDSNTVIGSYISINGGYNSTIINNIIINATGADFNNLGVETGGQAVITAASNSIIKNNTIINAKIISTGEAISVSDNCIVENNYIEVTLKGMGIYPHGLNITIKNNTIITSSGSGIIYKDYVFNLYVISNNIISQSGIGVLVQGSTKKMPGNITIIYNNITTGNEYAIDAKDADSSMYWEEHDNNVGNSKRRTPEGEFNPGDVVYNFKGKTYVITPSNYNQYINDNGGLNSNIEDGDILFFTGEFSNKVIYLTKAIKITGQNPNFYNTTFRISSDGVWIENLTIKNKDCERINAWGVLIYKVHGATIYNCNIEVVDQNAAYAIYVVESINIDVVNNTLYSRGNYLTYTLLAHTVDDCKFINNTIVTNGTGSIHIFENEHCLEGDSVCIDGDEVCPDGAENLGNHVLGEVYRTYGVLMAYSSDNIVSNNKLTVTSQLNQTYSPTSSTNSVVGIDLYYNSHNNVISDNIINIKSMDNYIYGVGVLGYYTAHYASEGQGALNNQFICNKIIIEGKYVVEGIIIGNEAINTIISNNEVNLKSNKIIYGINLETSQKSILSNNNLTLNADVIYGLEATSSNENIIVNNSIVANAKQIYGMVFSNSIKNNITSNIIFANSTGEEITFNNYDSIKIGNAGIYLQTNSSNNIIINNNITSKKDFAIKIDILAIDNIIENNYLDCENYIANQAVNNKTSQNIIEYNYKYLPIGNLNNSNIKYLQPINFIFTSDDLSLDGAIVKFYDFEDKEINSSMLSNGIAKYELKSTQYYIPGSYLISAKIFKENYKVTEFTSLLSVDYGDLNVSVDNVACVIARNSNFTAYVKNILGEGVPDIKVEFYIVDETYPVYIGSTISDKNGLAKLNTQTPMIYDENPIIKVIIHEQDSFNSVTAEADLKIIFLNETTLKVNNNIYPGAVFVVLNDKNSNALSGKKITITIGSKSFNQTTSIDGSILMPQMSRGTYTITVTFNGDESYYSSVVTKKITVLPSISENKNYNIYYGNIIQFKVRITGSDGKYVSSGKIVTIKVNGQTYQVKTDSKGYAVKNLKLNVGTYTIITQYNGDVVNNKIKVNPTLIAKNILKKKSKKIKFTVKLLNKNGKILKNKKIIFKIKNKKYTAKTNKKGIATVNILNLKVGTFTITSSYSGCSIKNTIKIKK